MLVTIFKNGSLSYQISKWWTVGGLSSQNSQKPVAK